MIVLKIIGFIILGVFALILAALCVKVKIFVEYSDYDTNLRLKWLFLNIPVYPGKGKTKTSDLTQADGGQNSETDGGSADNVDSLHTTDATDADAVNGEESADSEKNAEEAVQPESQKTKNNLLKTLYNAHGIDGLLLIVRRIFSYLGTFTGNAMRSLVIEELYIDVRCHRNDAASTAIYYGEVCSALFPMLGALVTRYKVRKYDINVYPDYLARTSSASFAVSMHVYPIYLSCISIAFVIKMLFKVLLRLIVKCFLPLKNNKEENNNKTDSKESVA